MQCVQSDLERQRLAWFVNACGAPGRQCLFLLLFREKKDKAKLACSVSSCGIQPWSDSCHLAYTVAQSYPFP